MSEAAHPVHIDDSGSDSPSVHAAAQEGGEAIRYPAATGRGPVLSGTLVGSLTLSMIAVVAMFCESII